MDVPARCRRQRPDGVDRQHTGKDSLQPDRQRGTQLRHLRYTGADRRPRTLALPAWCRIPQQGKPTLRGARKALRHRTTRRHPRTRFRRYAPLRTAHQPYRRSLALAGSCPPRRTARARRLLPGGGDAISVVGQFLLCAAFRAAHG